jgi:lipoprotein-releasing system ATP-binding protein
VILEAQGASKDFGPAGGPPRRVLDSVDLLVPAGERIVILGPSGAGKSTLLALLGGISAPSAGRILVDGNDLGRFSEREASSFRNLRVGFVFQLHHLLPQFTLLENVLLPVLARGEARREAVERALSWFQIARLFHRKDAYPFEVSVGESQRAAIFRALVNQPAVLLADEPTGSLDRDTSGRIVDFILEWRERVGAALVMVTHDRAVAERCAAGGRILCLLDGKLHAAS